MPTKFSADEVLEMAGRIETRGAKFYRKAAKIHVAARDLLMDIARQEDQHFATFAELRKKLTPSEQEPTAYDPYGESDLYLKAMVDGTAFDINQDPEELLTGRESLDDLFKMAIGLEKDSIVFYLGLRDLVPPAFGKERINEIVKEEMRHIAWLSNKRAELK
jgi:rubrerythrin